MLRGFRLAHGFQVFSAPKMRGERVGQMRTLLGTRAGSLLVSFPKALQIPTVTSEVLSIFCFKRCMYFWGTYGFTLVPVAL